MDLTERFKRLKEDLQKVQSQLEDNIQNLEGILRKSQKRIPRHSVRKNKRKT